MKLARVISHVVSTQKHDFYRGLTTFMVKPVRPDGTAEGTTFVAVDRVQSGIGDLVLIMQEGSSARHLFGVADAPVRSVIVGIVDAVDMEGNHDRA
ncbi:MAG TPA: EutN/CcmL family microcompartment protein [Candidatus Hydrogenedentes bacterium]|nr:EutN/CcmL family microcompartment protein [Candidatus Hydrogenedentota bacterium]HRK34602.1 EutN/CcmL family microcompartment protein [Candidatus Hydrogenedentota bacterium]